jgi:hypothetical protein
MRASHSYSRTVVLACFCVVADHARKLQIASDAEITGDRRLSQQCSGACDTLVERNAVVFCAVVECDHDLVECFGELLVDGFAVAGHCCGGVAAEDDTPVMMVVVVVGLMVLMAVAGAVQ